MIEYDAKHIGDLLRLSGSVLPSALLGAFPACLITLLLRTVVHYAGLQDYMDVFREPSKAVQMAWAMVTTVATFLVAYKTQLSYLRFWEGVTLVEQVRGSWLNAVSNLVAFCSQDPARRHDVRRFQHLLVRLMSLLFATSLEEISMNSRATSQEHDLSGIDGESLAYLRKQYAKRDVVLAWIQRLIIDNHNEGVISVAPPILTRVFQELSNGIVSVNDARKFTTIPLPFPFGQVVMVLLTVLCYILLPVGACIWLAPGVDVLCVFLIAVLYLAVNRIGLEIDPAFGEDANHLPLEEMQLEMNIRLAVLLEPMTQTTPKLPQFRNLPQTGGDGIPKVRSLPSLTTSEQSNQSEGGPGWSPQSWSPRKLPLALKTQSISRKRKDTNRRKSILLEQQHYIGTRLEQGCTEDIDVITQSSKAIEIRSAAAGRISGSYGNSASSFLAARLSVPPSHPITVAPGFQSVETSIPAGDGSLYLTATDSGMEAQLEGSDPARSSGRLSTHSRRSPKHEHHRQVSFEEREQSKESDVAHHYDEGRSGNGHGPQGNGSKGHHPDSLDTDFTPLQADEDSVYYPSQNPSDTHSAQQVSRHADSPMWACTV
mmetsp:Transcript_67527/g.162101  ORF Transcript_67527/g.162101 Transcript_67527/m.162101 type:complete len:598 (-) Transcript_67527:31-1824(-)